MPSKKLILSSQALKTFPCAAFAGCAHRDET
jgi:hypothetical protein